MEKKCCEAIMWLSSEMVDSCFIRAIVCSGQKEPKKPKKKPERAKKATTKNVTKPKHKRPKTQRESEKRNPQGALLT